MLRSKARIDGISQRKPLYLLHLRVPSFDLTESGSVEREKFTTTSLSP